MNSSIVHSRHTWKFILPIVLAIGLSGGFRALVRAGGVSLEFVGNLIQSVHDISLDRLYPTYPRCF